MYTVDTVAILSYIYIAYTHIAYIGTMQLAI